MSVNRSKGRSRLGGEIIAIEVNDITGLLRRLMVG